MMDLFDDCVARSKTSYAINELWIDEHEIINFVNDQLCNNLIHKQLDTTLRPIKKEGMWD